MSTPRTVASDALLTMLFPIWQFLIGALVLVTVVVSVHKLFQRGPSRMGGALLLAGGAVVGFAVLGYLIQLL